MLLNKFLWLAPSETELMNVVTDKELLKIKKVAAKYNMAANLFWSALHLTPISIFCFNQMSLHFFYSSLIISLLTALLPNSFFDTIQLGKTRFIYEKIGVSHFNKFTQNGDIINGLLRKKYPRYKVISIKALSIKKLLKQTYFFEAFHFSMFVFFTVTTIYVITKDKIIWAIIISITNVLYNIYPAFLQQYIRVRLTWFNKK